LGEKVGGARKRRVPVKYRGLKEKMGFPKFIEIPIRITRG